ncbi:MAG: hypothetical protein ACRDX8_07775 [Acidimicrobiales bacterium]
MPGSSAPAELGLDVRGAGPGKEQRRWEAVVVDEAVVALAGVVVWGAAVARLAVGGGPGGGTGGEQGATRDECHR